MFKKFFIIFFIISCHNLYAQFSFAPGAGLSLPYKSDQKDSDGNYRSDFGASIGLGIEGEVELFWRMAISWGINYGTGDAKVSYDYINSDDASDTGSLDDFGCVFYQFSGNLGLRFRLIDSNRFKFFIGGGILLGALSFQYYSYDYEDEKGDLDGFIYSDSAPISGKYFEFGMGYYWNDNNGLRLTVLVNDYEAEEKLESLGKTKLSGKFIRTQLSYVHLVDFSFFWK